MGTAVSRPLRIHNLDTTLSLHRPGGEICFFLNFNLSAGSRPSPRRLWARDLALSS